MHVDGSNRGILELDLSTVLGNDDEKKALGMVKSLDLSRNELSIISNLQPLTALTALNVHSNRITRLVGLPLGLTKLNVSRNQLTSLEGIAALPFLAELDISYNRIVSLSGLPRLSPLAVLEASHNRIASLAGIDALMKLQVLHLDSNYLCTVDDIRPLAKCATLKTLSLKNCPITELADYLSVLRSVCPRLLTLDGATLRYGTSYSDAEATPSNASQRSASGGMRSHQRGASGGERFPLDAEEIAEAVQERLGTPSPARAPHPGSHPVHQHSTTRPLSSVEPAAANSVRVTKAEGYSYQSTPRRGSQSNDLSFDNLVGKAEQRRNELAEQLKRVQREHQDTLLILEQERRECQLLHGKNQKLEAQLTEARRVLADELHQVAELKDAVHKLEDQVTYHKTRAEKLGRDYKYAQQKLRAEELKRTEEVERLNVTHEASISEMKEKLRANVESTKRMTSMDHSGEREVEALRRRVESLTAQNRSLTLDVTRLEDELNAVDDESLRQRRAEIAREELTAANLDTRRDSEPAAVRHANWENSKRQHPSADDVAQLPPAAALVDGLGADIEGDEFARSPPHRLRPDVVEEDDDEYFDDPLQAQRAHMYARMDDTNRGPIRSGHYCEPEAPEGSPNSHASVVDFAQQLKSWLLSEMQAPLTGPSPSVQGGRPGLAPRPVEDRVEGPQASPRRNVLVGPQRFARR